MTEEERTMIEEMVLLTGITPWQAKDVIPIIRRHVHLVAKVCPRCEGYGDFIKDKHNSRASLQNCDICHGHGVVAKEDK